MKKAFKIVLLSLATILVVGGGYAFWLYDKSKIPVALNMGSTDSGATAITKLVAPQTNAPTKIFDITAEVATVNLGNGKTTQAWTFNGTAPGPELRVQQGDHVVVHLTNKIPVGVTIHWHGLDVPNAEDGIAGVTQDAVKPGETYTYSFIADQSGTYWYHSHEDSSNEVGRGLFGVLVVEPKNSTVKYDKDYSVAMHEWNTTGNTNEGMGGMNMGGMKMSGSNIGGMNMSGTMDMSGPAMMPNSKQTSALTDMMSMYDVFTTDGTSEGLHLDAKPGDLVRLRLVNAGNMTHLVTLEWAKFQVVSMDGHDVTGATPIEKTLLPVGGAQRYDISFKMPQSGSVKLVDADPSNVENKMISATIGNGTPVADDGNAKDYPWFDFSKYGTAEKGQFCMDSAFTKRIT